jgi:hypothetical protein
MSFAVSSTAALGVRASVSVQNRANKRAAPARAAASQVRH